MDNPASAGNTGAQDGQPLVGCVDQFGVLWVRQFTGGTGGVTAGLPSTVQASSNPGAGVKASASLPASGGVLNASNVPLLVSWSIGDTAAIATATVVVRDGASGVGAILWQKEIGPLPANSYRDETIVIPFNAGVPGTANTAMTVEFLAAPAATGIQSVAIQGYLAK